MPLHAPLIIDIAGTSLTAIDRQRLAHPLVGGLILFARNFTSRAQLCALCAAIKRVRTDLLICVDHEGGRVQRFKTDGFTHLPPMRALGAMWMGKAGAMDATQAASACGYVLGAELRACGVDLSFTPVLDLDYQDGKGASRSTVIGDRAFHADARVVSLLAESLMHGLLQSGMANCGNHFPGHGFVQADSHVDIPVDRRSRKAILADDAAPYRWLSTPLASVMPAHVIYPKVDHRPAGFSGIWLEDILRAELADILVEMERISYLTTETVEEGDARGGRGIGFGREGVALPPEQGFGVGIQGERVLTRIQTVVSITR